MKFIHTLVAASVFSVITGAQASPQQRPQQQMTPVVHQQVVQQQTAITAKSNAAAVTSPAQQLTHGHEHDHHQAISSKDLAAPTAHSTFINPLAKDGSGQDGSAKNSSATLAACDIDALGSSSGNALISQIKSQGTSCLNELFSASASQQQAVYTSAKMIDVANHAQTLSTNYQGGGNVDIQALFLYLRAGYFTEFYNDNVSFSTSVTPAVKNAIDAFVNNSHFFDNNDDHGRTLTEVVITMDSSEQQDVYLNVAKQWLNTWDQTYADKWYMRNAVNGFFTLIFRGQWNSNFVTAVGTDSGLVTSLKNFALSSWMVGSDAEFMAANAARELGRLKTYSGTAIQPSVDAALNSIFSTYQMYGNGDAIWLGAADTASYAGDCAAYNICNFKVDLEAQVLGQIHVCSPTIKIRSQQLTALQQSSACATMGAEETLFHNRLATNNNPVADDNNTQLRINIFNSSADYQKYAGVIFGIGTNNGGMYLEGNPATVGNIPNFIAYEASYAEPDHYIWNLEHEYVHYLDGRFDIYGDFNAPTKPIVWWSEGVAEYISQQDDNQAAIDTILDGSTYPLSTIFATNYDGFDVDRIYRWGYLAVRFMFERHNDEVNQMLAATRAANWTAYQSRVDGWAAAYQAEFAQWSMDLANGSNSNQSPTANANGPYTGQVNSPVNFSSNGSTDADGSISSYLWNFGDNSTSNLANPSHSYSAQGTYSVSLTVTDNQGATTAVNTTATISTVQTGNQLTNGQAITIAGAQGSETFYQMTVPANASELSFAISGGTGDADLYVRFGQAPTQSVYDCRPWQGGNAETCTISNVQAGDYQLMIAGYNAYANVSLVGSYTPAASNVPDACASEGPISGGQLTAGDVACLASADPIWLSIGDVSSHATMAISTGNGSGDLSVQYKNGGWPSATDNDGSSNNNGNSECIAINTSSEYWGYLKVSGAAQGASIVVDFDTAGCR